MRCAFHSWGKSWRMRLAATLIALSLSQATSTWTLRESRLRRHLLRLSFKMQWHPRAHVLLLRTACLKEDARLIGHLSEGPCGRAPARCTVESKHRITTRSPSC